MIEVARLNARQKRLFEESLKKNPNLKMPSATRPATELTEEDLAMLKQGVGDKSSRPASSMPNADGSPPADAGPLTGAIVTYFEEKGFGFLRPDDGGRDIFFHVSRLSQGQPTELTPGTKIIYELGMDRNGKMAASDVRIAPAAPAAPAPPKTTQPPK